MHVKTIVLISVPYTSFVLGLSLIPPLRSLSDVAKGRPIEKKSQVITPTITPESELEWTFEFV